MTPWVFEPLSLNSAMVRTAIYAQFYSAFLFFVRRAMCVWMSARVRVGCNVRVFAEMCMCSGRACDLLLCIRMGVDMIVK